MINGLRQKKFFFFKVKNHKFKVIFIIIFILTIYYLNNKLDLQFNSNILKNLILPAIISDLPK